MRRQGHQKGYTGLIIIIFIVALLGGGVFYIFTSEKFEQTPPAVEISHSEYWNTLEPLKVTLSDNIGLKSYTIALGQGDQELIVAQEDNLTNIKKRVLEVKYPTKHFADGLKNIELSVKVNDTSKWNLFAGNSATVQKDLKIDHIRPSVNILSNSYSISKGGSALVIFQAYDDDQLANLYIQAGGREFKVQPYKKEGYYISLFAWPFQEEEFQAKIVAIDRAGNSRKVEIPLYLKNVKYNTSTIQASDKFIDGKITDLSEGNSKYMKDDRLERLKAVNETMRIENEKLIHKYASGLSNEMINEWNINKFYPLRNGQKVANFGDHRYYYYDDKEKIISESYHLGYDMASTKMASMIASNDGQVVFAGYNGIYGNMPIIDHGLGLYSLYGHCTSLDVKEGDMIKAGETIGKTGTTGLALGDHLHFGVLVQGVEVRPIEWLDSKWIQDNIKKIINDANKIIEQQ